MSKLTGTINEHISKRVHCGELENEDMISIVQNFEPFLQLITYADYGKKYNKDYNVVKAMLKSGKLKDCTLFGTKYIIDND